jgi:hypothetical protein
MKMDRNTQVLITGLEAAHERMFSDAGLRRPEYPRDLQKLYSNMEDALFALFTVIQNEEYTLVKKRAADVIVTASEVIEYVKLLEKVADKPWDTDE